MVKGIHIWVLTVLVVLNAGAQQDPQFNQSYYNTILFNPGSAGSNNAICATAINRQQWRGMEGAPVSTLFTINSPFRLFGADHGAGMHILSDQNMFQTDISINIAYAYRMNLGPGKLGIGMGFGMINTELEGTKFSPGSSGTSPPVSDFEAVTPDFSAGLHYYTEDFHFGLSVTHINQPSIDFPTEYRPYLNRHYYMTSGYDLLLNQSFTTTPRLFVQSDGIITQIKMGSTINYENKISGGIFYRFGSSIVGVAGIELFNGVNVSYSYDISTTPMGKRNSGSHEFMIRYCFELDLDRTDQRYRSIRIL